jgi:hypothetical protein
LIALAKRILSLWVPIAVGMVIMGTWLLMDTSPVTYRLFPVLVVDGRVESSAEYTGNPSDGATNLFVYSYRDKNGADHRGKSWAPTLNSKPGIFWKPFPLLAPGCPVKIEYFKWNPTRSRISGMRTSNLSFDGALFVSFLGVVAILANWKGMQGSRLFFKKPDQI